MSIWGVGNLIPGFMLFFDILSQIWICASNRNERFIQEIIQPTGDVSKHSSTCVRAQNISLFGPVLHTKDVNSLASIYEHRKRFPCTEC